MLRFCLFAGVASAAVHASDPSVTLSNGVEMPLVACGSGGDSNAEAKSGVRLALQSGFKHIDTAHDYGCLTGVHDGIADWLAASATHKRGDFFLTSKVPGCGVPTQGLQPPCKCYHHHKCVFNQLALRQP